MAKYEEDSKKGVILEVVLEYPQELHDLHNDYEKMKKMKKMKVTKKNEKMKATKDMLSPYCESIRKLQCQHQSST